MVVSDDVDLPEAQIETDEMTHDHTLDESQVDMSHLDSSQVSHLTLFHNI